MRSKPLLIAVLSGACMVLGGCATSGGLLTGPDNFGEAYRQTLQAQIIDPAPEYETALGQTAGTQVAGAIQRYRTGAVKQPGGQGISSIGRNGGGGSSGVSTSSN